MEPAYKGNLPQPPTGGDSPIRLLRIRLTQGVSLTGVGNVPVPLLEHYSFHSVDHLLNWMMRVGFQPARHGFDKVFVYHESEGLIPDLTQERLSDRYAFLRGQRGVGAAGGP